MDAARLRRIARRQHGLFHRDQAYDCGYTPRQVRRRVADGQWRSVFGPILAAAEIPITPGMVDRAVQLSVRDSVLAGPSAAVRHGMRVPRSQPCLIVGRRIRRLGGVTILVDRLDPRDGQTVEGLKVTSPERTIVDRVLRLPEQSGLDLVDHALQPGVTTVARLVERARPGRAARSEEAGPPGRPDRGRHPVRRRTPSGSAAARRSCDGMGGQRGDHR